MWTDIHFISFFNSSVYVTFQCLLFCIVRVPWEDSLMATWVPAATCVWLVFKLCAANKLTYLLTYYVCNYAYIFRYKLLHVKRFTIIYSLA